MLKIKCINNQDSDCIQKVKTAKNNRDEEEKKKNKNKIIGE